MPQCSEGSLRQRAVAREDGGKLGAAFIADVETKFLPACGMLSRCNGLRRPSRAALALALALLASACGPGQRLGPMITPSPSASPEPSATPPPTPTSAATAYPLDKVCEAAEGSQVETIGQLYVPDTINFYEGTYYQLGLTPSRLEPADPSLASVLLWIKVGEPLSQAPNVMWRLPQPAYTRSNVVVVADNGFPIFGAVGLVRASGSLRQDANAPACIILVERILAVQE
jgi:hypothetical protein